MKKQEIIVNLKELNSKFYPGKQYKLCTKSLSDLFLYTTTSISNWDLSTKSPFEFEFKCCEFLKIIVWSKAGVKCWN